MSDEIGESFSAHWLTLREPHDRVARAADLDAALAQWVADRPAISGQGRLNVLDLGCGTGSNLRYLSPRLPGLQHWRLLDHDPALLAVASAVAGGGAAATVSTTTIETRQCDLAVGLATLPWRETGLVTGSALLDLVSDDWARRLVDCLGPAAGDRPAVLFALSYDGRMDWLPGLPRDADVLDRFNAHQRTDKGFGPALGPAGAGQLGALLADAGYAVRRSPSPWRFGVGDGPMQRAIVTGSIAALSAACPDDAGWMADWLSRRLQWIDAAASTLTVGHDDLLGLPR